MKNIKIIINNQEELDKIERVERDEELIVACPGLRLNRIVELVGNCTLRYDVNTDWLERRFFKTTGAPEIVTQDNSAPLLWARGTSAPRIWAQDNSAPVILAWGNSEPEIVARDNSAPRIDARENSTPRIDARDNSAPVIDAWENSTPKIDARGNSKARIEAREHSAPVIYARETSEPRIEARENSAPVIVASDHSIIRGTGISSQCVASLFDFSTLVIPATLNVQLKYQSETSVIQRIG